MISVITLLTILLLSLTITRIGTVALMMTGLSRDVAQFQARSAFTGVGFCTQEAETIMRDPVRRQIIMILMLAGNLGIATVVATLVVSMMRIESSEQFFLKAVGLVGGLFLLWQLARSKIIDDYMSQFIAWALKRLTKLELRDYVALLHLAREYAVLELRVEHGHWLVNKRLRELKLNAEGILVLGIERGDGQYIGVPTGETSINGDDTLILYGPMPRLEELDRRRADLAGYLAHLRAKHERDKLVEEQHAEHR